MTFLSLQLPKYRKGISPQKIILSNKIKSHLNTQLIGKLTSKSWTLLKSMEKQKWCDVAGTAIFCPEAVSEALAIVTGWATEAGTAGLIAKMNINKKIKKKL